MTKARTKTVEKNYGYYKVGEVYQSKNMGKEPVKMVYLGPTKSDNNLMSFASSHEFLVLFDIGSEKKIISDLYLDNNLYIIMNNTDGSYYMTLDIIPIFGKTK